MKKNKFVFPHSYNQDYVGLGWLRKARRPDLSALVTIRDKGETLAILIPFRQFELLREEVMGYRHGASAPP